MPPLSPTQQYEPDSKTALASTSPLGIRVDASAVAASRDGPEDRHRRCPPRLTLSLFLHDFAPPPPSRCAVASLIAPPPLSPRLRHYCSANACLIAPLSHQRLVVASSPLSPRQCLSCRAGASLVVPVPLSLRRGLSCGASPAPAGCRFVNYLNVPLSLLSRRLVVALLPLSLHRCLSLRHLSHCAAVSLSHRHSQPQ